MREHSSRVINEDLRDLENVREVSMLELLLSHLPECVASPLSINSLSKLLQVAHATIDNWLTILERLYVCYRIPPFGAKRIRAVRKEKKLYFWDWSRVGDSPGRGAGPLDESRAGTDLFGARSGPVSRAACSSSMP